MNCHVIYMQIQAVKYYLRDKRWGTGLDWTVYIMLFTCVGLAVQSGLKDKMNGFATRYNKCGASR